MLISHILELFDYSAWANGKLFEVAEVLDDEDLDRGFDIGPGTLREVVRHIYGAERIWYERIGGTGYSESRSREELEDVGDLKSAWESLNAARESWLQSLGDADLAKAIAYTNMAGDPFETRLGDILTHVCDHGAHHRAQAANMTRHIGEPFRNSDYLFFRLAHPTVAPPTAETIDFLRGADIEVGEAAARPRSLSLSGMRDLFAYNDWANDLLLDAAKQLSDEQLDREFEMGMGTLRKTLLHVESAERFWGDHWAGDEKPHWQDMDASIRMADLVEAWRLVRQRREESFRGFDDAALLDEVVAEPAPGMFLTFRRGETMLQIAQHGTHHRAQALNMLRRLADISLQMSIIVFTRRK
ncbi:MAG TPA: DinB family protein [Phycisphaerae bacterium]|nr:DinB family protein [Phycisphaerae bacterium]HRW54948.1 DinB family protein [Phycisphaerae bacterium]